MEFWGRGEGQLIRGARGVSGVILLLLLVVSLLFVVWRLLLLFLEGGRMVIGNLVIGNSVIGNLVVVALWRYVMG